MAGGQVRRLVCGALEIAREDRDVANLLGRLKRPPESTDDFLLALSEAGEADYLVTSDKSGSPSLDRHKAPFPEGISEPRLHDYSEGSAIAMGAREWSACGPQTLF